MESLKLTIEKMTQVAADAFFEVIRNYIYFIAEISKTLSSCLSEEENLEAVQLVHARKFTAIKKELYNFLSLHKEFFKLNKILIELEDGSVLFERDISILDNDEGFLCNNDALMISELFNDDTYLVPDVTCNFGN